jgi:uncharacterized membrane protein YqiK
MMHMDHWMPDNFYISNAIVIVVLIAGYLLWRYFRKKRKGK